MVKKLPRFDSEDAERQFWAAHDASDYFDLASAKRTEFPNLRPSTQTISLRLPVAILADLKAMASRLDVPYQSLMKVLIAEGVDRRRRRPSRLSRPRSSKLTAETATNGGRELRG
ncbi:MAG: hypothetical protein EPO26_14380 [Chloroflexota bacterium]|nr:MAG: hypothetical protein EPO26_14380 [Chloroflexota bacterium]